MGLKRVEHIRGAKKLGVWKGEQSLPFRVQGRTSRFGEEGVMGFGKGATPPSFEPATCRLRAGCSAKLSYGPDLFNLILNFFNGKKNFRAR